MPHDLRLTSLTGREIEPHLDDLARLRIAVFREYPYLYDGTAAYERDYLQTYRDAPDALVVIAQDAAGHVVGASTGLPVAQEETEFGAPFKNAGIDPAEVFYFGESVLLPEFRGRGVGWEFMNRRESHARSLPGIRLAAFCAVDRPDDHPRRPTDYRPLDDFWKRCGFTKRPDLTTRFNWKEVGDAEETSHTLTFWIKPL